MINLGMQVDTRFVDSKCGWVVRTWFPKTQSSWFSWFVCKPTRKQRAEAIRMAIRKEITLRS